MRDNIKANNTRDIIKTSVLMELILQGLEKAKIRLKNCKTH